MFRVADLGLSWGIQPIVNLAVSCVMFTHASFWRQDKIKKIVNSAVSAAKKNQFFSIFDLIMNLCEIKYINTN